MSLNNKQTHFMSAVFFAETTDKDFYCVICVYANVKEHLCIDAPTGGRGSLATMSAGLPAAPADTKGNM